MPDPKSKVTPTDRGEKLLALLDTVAERLSKELSTEGELKSSLVTNALDLLRWSGMSAATFVNFAPRESLAALSRRLPFPEGVTLNPPPPETPALDAVLDESERQAVSTPFQ
jgi:hypothetical protein